MSPSHHFSLYVDGACSGNPGPGGWAYLGFSDATVLEGSGGMDATTNNRMELTAAIEGIRAIGKTANGALGPKALKIFSDSQYVIKGATAWVLNWQKNGWKNSQGAAVLNQDLWIQLTEALKDFKNRVGGIEWAYVAGHSGNWGNDRVDQLAVRQTRQARLENFVGRFSEYAEESALRRFMQGQVVRVTELAPWPVLDLNTFQPTSHAECVWKEGMLFDTKLGAHQVLSDAKSPLGRDAAPSPKQLVLAGLCGCTAIDVLSLLRKHKQVVEAFEVISDVESTKEHPVVFSKIKLVYRVRGAIDPVVMQEAVELSQSKYCGVSAMIAQTAAIFYTVEVNGVQTSEGRAQF